MSYDLFLKSKKNDFLQSDFIEYFSYREHYTLEGNQAWYQNENTHVYFSFDFQEKDKAEEGEEFYPVAFNMNYFRPSYFAYEAEPEVRHFINAFSLGVEDPQSEGMETNKYETEKFLSGWAHGNEFAYRAILEHQPEIHVLPKKILKHYWEWNFHKEELQNSLVDDVFVPQIMLINYQGNIKTAVVWPDAIPSLFPKVDILLIGRKGEMAIGLWSDFCPLLEKYKTKMQNGGYYLYYESPPEEICKAMDVLSPSKEGELQGVASDQVLDAELVQKYT